MNWINYLEINEKYIGDELREKCILFVFLYMQLNSYCNDKYGKKTSEHCKMVDRLSSNTKLKQAYTSIDIEEKFINTFSNILLNGVVREYVIDMKRTKNKKYFNNHNNQLQNFLDVIYQIRCNMFHGSKSPYEDRNIKLIAWAYDCLNELLKNSGLLD